ncbi:isoleucyl-tRNA synthetase domain protein, partial [Chlamydia psittaci 84-8471/1]
RF